MALGGLRRVPASARAVRGPVDDPTPSRLRDRASSPAISDTPRFLALDPRGTLLVSVPRAGRVVALPDDEPGRPGGRVVPVVEGLELPHGLAFLDGQLYVAETGRVVRFDYDPAARRVGRRADGRRAGPPGARQPLDPNHRHRAGPPALRVGGVLVQQLRGARPPARRHLPLRRRRSSRRAVRDGTPQRGRARLPPRSGRALGHRQRSRLARGRPARGVRHPGRGGRLLRLAVLPLDARRAGARSRPRRRATTAGRRAGRASSIRRTRRRSGSPSTRGPSSLRSIAAISSSRSTAPGTARSPSATR